MTAPTPNAMPGATTAVATPPESPPPAAPVTPPAADPAPAAPAADAKPDNRPPWEQTGEPFDPERAWNLIQNKTKDLADYKARTDPIVAEREQLRRASMEEAERLQEDLGARTKGEETWRDIAIHSKAEALAAGRFIDAETALALVGDLSQYATDDAIDIEKLTARLDQLATEKPFLVAITPPPGFTPNRAQGQAGTGGAIPLDAQIREAEKRGDFQASIALKQQRFHQQNRS